MFQMPGHFRFPAKAPLPWLAVLLALGLVAVSTGCRNAAFYQQAVSGHASIVLKKRSIQSVVAHPDTPPRTRDKLELILQLRAFAETELGLPAKGQFRHYADIDRPFVVWDIYAAPEFSLEPKSWWYPFVGKLTYRGFFKEQRARADARRLQDKGYDVYVGGIDAYSTLGWFQDPVLSTFIDRQDVDLADLVFHELAHQKLFIDGDTDFNEAFATAVAREGVRRWMRHQADAEDLNRWEESTRREERFIALVLDARRQLEALYEAAGPESSLHPDQAQRLRRRKAGVFHQLRADYEQLKQTWNQLEEFDRWFDYPLNNARLNAEATYYERIPAFEQLLRECGNNLPSFYQAVDHLGRREPADRDKVLEALHQRASPMGIPNLAEDHPATTPKPGG